MKVRKNLLTVLKLSSLQEQTFLAHLFAYNILHHISFFLKEKDSRDPNGLRCCGFFQIQNDKIVFQRSYWDKLSFLKLHNFPLPH
jgi:hypothetical protein